MTLPEAGDCGGRSSLLASSRSQQCAGIYCNVYCTSGIKTSVPELVILIGWYLQIEHKGAMKQLVFYLLPWNVELCKAIFIC